MANSRNKYSDKDILSQLKDHCKRNGKITKKSFDADKTVCSGSLVYLRFGNWQETLLKAGVLKKQQEVPKKREKKYTIAELIGKYRRLRKKEKYKNTGITMEDFCRETFINSKLIIDIFETWEDFCEISKPYHYILAENNDM